MYRNPPDEKTEQKKLNSLFGIQPFS